MNFYLLTDCDSNKLPLAHWVKHVSPKDSRFVSLVVNLIVLISISIISVLSWASLNAGLLASKMYPSNKDDQAFTAKFFDLVEAHKTKDPLLGAKGPSIYNFSLDKIKFAFMTNINNSKGTVDLIFFNCTLGSFEGLEQEEELSKIYESTVYILRGVSQKSISSQGGNKSALTNFSYLFGANTFSQQLKNDYPTLQVPQDLLDWKPHSEYMNAGHPLRQALNTNTLSILSPSREITFRSLGITEATQTDFESKLSLLGGFENLIMGMMIHEMYHIKEGEDQLNRLTTKRTIKEDRKEIIAQFKSNRELRELLIIYVKIIFSIGDSLKKFSITEFEIEQLSDLKVVVNELKSKYNEAWNFIWNYEYTEGFAEYVSAYSMIQERITSLAQKIDLEKMDSNNNFTYRTGTIGGLYLANRFQKMPFENKEDHRESVWEIILRLKQIMNNAVSIDSLRQKYSDVQVDSEKEIQMAITFLASSPLKQKAMESNTTNNKMVCNKIKL